MIKSSIQESSSLICGPVQVQDLSEHLCKTENIHPGHWVSPSLTSSAKPLPVTIEEKRLSPCPPEVGHGLLTSPNSNLWKLAYHQGAVDTSSTEGSTPSSTLSGIEAHSALTNCVLQAVKHSRLDKEVWKTTRKANGR
jgi:hypothetical protein